MVRLEDHLPTGSRTNYYSVKPPSNKFVQHLLLETSWVFEELRLPGKALHVTTDAKDFFLTVVQKPGTRQADRDRSSIVELSGIADNDVVGVVIISPAN